MGVDAARMINPQWKGAVAGGEINLTLVRRIAARPSIVFEALTTADGIASWWAPGNLPVSRAEIDARGGGTYRVCFRTVDGLEHQACGECLEVTKPVRLVVTCRWAWGGDLEGFGRVSRIEIALRPIENGTELTVTHALLVHVPARKKRPDLRWRTCDPDPDEEPT
jgi:uncharacterized protein YndB with AHSA1/START domain